MTDVCFWLIMDVPAGTGAGLEMTEPGYSSLLIPSDGEDLYPDMDTSGATGISGKISTTLVGAAGEYHVLSQLLRRGWIAALAPDGAPNMDILVTDEANNKLCAIQVKTRRDIGADKGWHMKPKHEGMIAPDLFYVFVDVGSTPSDPTICYILPSRIVADCIRSCHEVWLSTPGRNGNAHNDSKVRRLLPDYSNINPVTARNIAIIDNYRSGWLDRYRENWGVLGLPETSKF